MYALKFFNFGFGFKWTYVCFINRNNGEQNIGIPFVCMWRTTTLHTSNNYILNKQIQNFCEIVLSQILYYARIRVNYKREQEKERHIQTRWWLPNKIGSCPTGKYGETGKNTQRLEEKHYLPNL